MDWSAKIDEELAKLPEEFRGPVYSNAYEYGHSAGESEVYGYISDLVDALKPAIEDYCDRIETETLRLIYDKP